ncbi:MAG: hypothetical protein JSW03_08795 [Candidatus Eiseniibacteriota bacterium]|nr:MAG: hypothetical protein JSW03_08795 [Candidatus Eisenbacteria bacterium]
MKRWTDLRKIIRGKGCIDRVLAESAVQRVRCTLGKARRLRLLPYALLFASVAALPVLTGCVAHVHARFPLFFHAHRYSPRPHPQYYCYDCHGYTYFDPYYDFCAHYGFRIRWDRYSSLRHYHERYYPRIRRATPHFGEYKYKPDYRKSPQYKKPVDYGTWKKSKERTFYSGKTQSGGDKSTKSKSGQSKPSKKKPGRSSSSKE